VEERNERNAETTLKNIKTHGQNRLTIFAYVKHNQFNSLFFYVFMWLNLNKMPIEPETITKIQEEVETETMVAEEGQTIVHCICGMEAAYRIWPTTYLIESSGKRAKLVTAFNVSFYPYWTLKNAGQKFTLIFEGLSKDCIIFDLKEEIPQEGGFFVKGIMRNKSDVYIVNIG
jgi:hypothetical protein